MHAAVLAVLLAANPGGTAYATDDYSMESTHCDSGACGCECGSSCGNGGRCAHLKGRLMARLADPSRRAWGRPMPQTCYAPRFGCYPGNNRHMHRYPAFHGTYYRRPYNYRNYFDYPWHAGLHEPTSLFSYGVWDETIRDFEGSPAEILPQGANTSRAPAPTPSQPPRPAEASRAKRDTAAWTSSPKSEQVTFIDEQTDSRRFARPSSR